MTVQHFNNKEYNTISNQCTPFHLEIPDPYKTTKFKHIFTIIYKLYTNFCEFPIFLTYT